MSPKKRGRKPKNPEAKLVVPPKKRKGIFETLPVFNNQDKLIPEWLKLSIQILLINFHHEGVALLNSIQAEYEAVYKDTKVDPQDYDFQDWESMLKSPQFKQHCHVYIDKKMPWVKGYPLPRSASINMRNNRWEITPQIEPFQPLTVDEIKVPNSITVPNDKEDNLTTCDKDSKSSEETLVLKSLVPPNIEEVESKTVDEIRNSPSPEPLSMPKLTSMNCISPPEIENGGCGDFEDISNTSGTFSPKDYGYYPSGRKRRRGSFDESNFFRRSDVPATWMRVEEDEAKGSDEPKKVDVTESSKDEENVIEDIDLVIDEDPRTPPDSALSPETSPPHLDPVEVFIHPKKKTPKKSSKSRSPKKRYLRKKNAEIKEKSVRRISESSDSNSNSPNSNVSPSTEVKTSRGSKSNVESFFPWQFIPVLIPKLDRGHSIELPEIGIHPESIINPIRDPRLNSQVWTGFGNVAEMEEDIQNGPTENEISEIIHHPDPISHLPPQPNLKITITQQPLDPRKTTHSAISLKRFNETNAIPQDNFTYKDIRFTELWNETKWKHRFDKDVVPPSRFFKSNIFERWREAWRVNLSDKQLDYFKELQVYDEKPYPSRTEFYLRSALRMVEIDYLTDFQFSEPRTPDGESLVGPNDVLFYCDFAGAPGGVIEFYNKRRRWGSKGFGVSYQKRSYDLYSIPEAIPEYFEPFYGKLNSLNGDGSLFCADTVQLFVNRVLDATQGQGVHVVSTVGNIARVTFEDDNDEKWKYQHLSQLTVSMMVLREGGNMAFKMYDIKSAFVAGLVYILYRSFKYVQIAKLHIFAPGSAERVVVCIGKRPNNEVSEIIKFLQECHKVLAEWYLRDRFSKNKRTIEELVPLCTMEKSQEFMTYLRDSNERLKRTQLEEFLVSMKNLRMQGSIFSKGTYRALIAKTTELWNIGERPAYVPKPQKHPVAAFKELQVYPEDVCEAVETILNEYNLYTIFASAQQWRFIPVGNISRSRGFYLGVDGYPHFFNMKFKEWLPVRDYEFRLPSKTLVYAEIVSVFTEDKDYGEELFSIIDGIELAGQDIRNLPYCQRIRECEKFGTAVTKTFFPRMTRFTVTRSYDLSLLPQFLQKIESIVRANKTVGANTEATKTLILSSDTVFSNGWVKDGKQCWFNPSGVLFFEADTSNKATDFCASLFSRVYWEWVAKMDLPLPNAVLSVPEDLINVSLDTALITTGERPIGSVSAKKLIDFVNRYA